MDFEEWKKQRDIELDDAPISAQEIWEAATKAAREACADIADEAERHGWTGAVIANSIRMSSNEPAKGRAESASSD